MSEVSGASKRANGRASGPVRTSRFMAVLNHSAKGAGVKGKGDRLYMRLVKGMGIGSKVGESDCYCGKGLFFLWDNVRSF